MWSHFSHTFHDNLSEISLSITHIFFFNPDFSTKMLFPAANWPALLTTRFTFSLLALTSVHHQCGSGPECHAAAAATTSTVAMAWALNETTLTTKVIIIIIMIYNND